MTRLLKAITICILTVGLALGSMTAMSFDASPYHLIFGEARWQTKYNDFIDACTTNYNYLVNQIGSLNSLVSNWTLTENYPVVFTGALRVDADTLTVPGDQTGTVTAGKLLWADCGATDGVKPSTVSSSSYAGGLTTVNINDAILTTNLRAVSVVMSRNGVFPSTIGWVFGTDYGSPGKSAIDAALAVIGVNERSLHLGPGTWTIDADLSIPANVTLKPERGAVLTRATGSTHLTVNGPFECGLWQCFNDNSISHDWVVLGTGTVDKSYLEWWGGKGDGTTDNSAAFFAAINAYNVVHLGDGTYVVAAAAHSAMPSIKNIGGNGWTSIIKRASSFNGDIFTLAINASNITFKDFAYDGNRLSTDASGNQFIQGTGNHNHVTLDNIYCHDYSDLIFNAYGANDYFTLKSSLFVNAWHRGVMSFAGSYAQIYYNQFYGMNDSCIFLINGDYAQIHHNICFADGVVESVNDGIVLDYGDHASIHDNYACTPTGTPIKVYKEDSTRIIGHKVSLRHNICDAVAADKAAISVETYYDGVDIDNNPIEEGNIYISDCDKVNINESKMYGVLKAYIEVAAVSRNVTGINLRNNYSAAPKNFAFYFSIAVGKTMTNLSVNGNQVDDVVADAYDIGIFASGGGTLVNATAEGNKILGAATRISVAGLAAGTFARRNNRFSTGAVSGRAVLVDGIVVVSTAEVEAADSILLTRVASAGTARGSLGVGTIIAGTSFVIRSDDAGGSLCDDDSTIFWEIVH